MSGYGLFGLEYELARSIHPFPARMAPEVAMAVVGGSAPSMRILDPMCGSGTVLSLGVRGGHEVTGYDLDPLAVLISRVATQPIDADVFNKLANECLATARRARATDSHWSDSEMNRTGIVGGSRLWKQGWSHGKEQPTKKPAGEALLT